MSELPKHCIYTVVARYVNEQGQIVEERNVHTGTPSEEFTGWVGVGELLGLDPHGNVAVRQPLEFWIDAENLTAAFARYREAFDAAANAFVKRQQEEARERALKKKIVLGSPDDVAKFGQNRIQGV